MFESHSSFTGDEDLVPKSLLIEAMSDGIDRIVAHAKRLPPELADMAGHTVGLMLSAHAAVRHSSKQNCPRSMVTEMEWHVDNVLRHTGEDERNVS